MLFQAWLGKLVVDSNLAPYKITVHMFMAIIIFMLNYFNFIGNLMLNKINIKYLLIFFYVTNVNSNIYWHWG